MPHALLMSIFLSTCCMGGGITDSSCSLEMEVFYYVFGSVRDFDVLYKVEIKDVTDFQFDEDVYLYFKCQNNQLMFLRMEHSLSRKQNEYALKGKVCGFGDEKGVILTTFDFSSMKISQPSDFALLKYSPNRTPIVRIWFSARESDLQYEKYEYVKTLNSKPIRFK